MTAKLKRKPRQTELALRHAIVIGGVALLLALPVGFAAQTVLAELPYLSFSIVILLIVIGIGNVFDIIGVAVTAAQEAPLNARAARRVFGARRAVSLVKNAHKAASFCNDVVGDVSGTLSGAIGISIVYQLSNDASPFTAIVVTTVVSAIVAGLIVGGKAFGKGFAIQSGTDIVFQVGRVLEAVELVAAGLFRGRKPRRP